MNWDACLLMMAGLDSILFSLGIYVVLKEQQFARTRLFQWCFCIAGYIMVGLTLAGICLSL